MIDRRPELQDLRIPDIPVRLIASIVAIILLIFLVWTSCYTVQAESEGVVLRFGKFLKTVEPGLHFKLPFGIDHVTVLPTRRQLKIEFGFSTLGYTNPYQAGNDPREERSMVTGDLNAALVEWVVQYRIEDPKQYLFDVRNPDQTLRDLSEAAVREVIGDLTVDEVITIGRQDIEISALAQTYGVGRTPTPEEVRAWDISIGPTGEELPPGRGTAKEGAQLYRSKGCAGCHGGDGHRGHGSHSEEQSWCRDRALGTRANPAASCAVRDDRLGLHQSSDASQ